MSMNNECAGLFGEVFGHKFRERFDDVLSDAAQETIGRIEEIDSVQLPHVIDAFKERIYIHDVCVRCGQVVRRFHTEEGG